MKIPARLAAALVLAFVFPAPAPVSAQQDGPADDPSAPDSRYQQGLREGYRAAIQSLEDRGYGSRRHSHRRTIRIDSAVYGSKFGTCNFKSALAAQADGLPAYRFSAGNDWCGDPSPGNFKSAFVSYSCGRRGSRPVEVRQGYSAQLGCD